MVENKLAHLHADHRTLAPTLVPLDTGGGLPGALDRRGPGSALAAGLGDRCGHSQRPARRTLAGCRRDPADQRTARPLRLWAGLPLTGRLATRGLRPARRGLRSPADPR